MRITLSHIAAEGITALVDWPCTAMPGNILRLEGSNELTYAQVLNIDSTQGDLSKQQLSLKLLSGKPSMAHRQAKILTREDLVQEVRNHHQRLFSNEPTAILGGELPLSMEALGGLTLISSPDANSFSACSPALLSAFSEIAQPIIIDTCGQLKDQQGFQHLTLGNTSSKTSSPARLSIDLLGIEFLLTTLPAFFPASLREDVLKTLAALLPSEAGFLSVEQLLEPTRLSGLLSQLPSAGRSPLIRLLHEGISLGLFARTLDEVLLPNQLTQPTILDLSELRPSWRPWCLEAILQTCYQTLHHRSNEAKPILLTLVHPEYLGCPLQKWSYLFESQQIALTLILNDRANLIGLKHQATTYMAFGSHRSLKLWGQLTHHLPVLTQLAEPSSPKTPPSDDSAKASNKEPAYQQTLPETAPAKDLLEDAQAEDYSMLPDEDWISEANSVTLPAADQSKTIPLEKSLPAETFLNDPEAFQRDIEDFTPQSITLTADLDEEALSAQDIMQNEALLNLPHGSTPSEEVPSLLSIKTPTENIIATPPETPATLGWLEFDLPLPGESNNSGPISPPMSAFEPDSNSLASTPETIHPNTIQPNPEKVISIWDHLEYETDSSQQALVASQQESITPNFQAENTLPEHLEDDPLKTALASQEIPSMLSSPIESAQDDVLNSFFPPPQELTAHQDPLMSFTSTSEAMPSPVLPELEPSILEAPFLDSLTSTSPLPLGQQPITSDTSNGLEPSAAEDPDASSAPSFTEGQRVNHPQYGQGVVQSIINMGNRSILNIQFETAGKRLLDPSLSQLEKVS
jgi:hypothetical protein